MAKKAVKKVEPVYFFGWNRDQPDHRDFKFSVPRKLAALEPIVDMRDKMPAIYDQGALGSCTANATAAQCQFLDKTDPFQPSRLFIYYGSRALEGTIRYDSGSSIRDSIRSVVRWGFPPEVPTETHKLAYPYDISKFKKTPPKAIYATATKERISQYERVQQTEQAICYALSQGFPVNFGFTVYESCLSDTVAKNGILPMPHHGERRVGGHAVLLVGYNLEKRVYYVRNSWGVEWGQRGYFEMPFDYVHSPNLSADFWIVKAVP